MKLLKPTLFLTLMFTVMGALLGATASHVVISSSAFAQTSSLAQDISDSAQQETDSSSSSGADDNTQTDTNTQSFDLDLNQDVEAEVEQEAEQATGNVALQDQEDTTPPTLIVPEDITQEATSSDGVEVSFEVTAENNVDGAATLDEENTLIQDDVGGSITISCDPPSGSTFPIGETVVECTATDEAGNTAAATFTVTVNPPEEPEGTVITITGTTSGEKFWILEDLHQSEICTNAGTIVTGPGVTPLGEVPSCPSNSEFGWDISPNPDGLDTTYRVEGNGILGGGTNADQVELHDGRETDNDVYILDVNQFIMFDGPGDDRYDLFADLVDFGEEVVYRDSVGNDRMTFLEEE